jgi:hypothetical protein
MSQAIRLALLLFLVAPLFACSGPVAQDPVAVPTVAPLFSGDETAQAAGDLTNTPPATSPEPGTATPAPPPADFVITMDTTASVHPISPLIYGVSGAPDEVLAELRPTLNSWGGNPSTRYNWRLGNAWNAGSDWEYRNVDYSEGLPGSASDRFIAATLAAGAEVRLAMPTLGWVARDNDSQNCAFPLPGGGCGLADGSDCRHAEQIADPNITSVASTTEDIVAWARHLYQEQGYDVRFLAMDNEPELWGYTHYDVHPECTTYQETLDKYLSYAAALRAVAPEAELTGPATCCWTFYWDSAAGLADKAQHDFQDFLPWFLREVKAHDDRFGQRTLDVLDVHYYPEGVFNDKTDEATAAQRLRSTRSLWDPNYLDESWIAIPIQLIPRLRQLAEGVYPGTRLGLSEWNWGADESLNGALAIADVLGIFGREDLYFAAYWRYPPPNSPGFYAFRLYTNYDGQGSRFGDTSVRAISFDQDRVASYAALDSDDGDLHLMLINKQPDREMAVQVRLAGFRATSPAQFFRLDGDELENIVTGEQESSPNWLDIRLPAYSITHLVIPQDGG